MPNDTGTPANQDMDAIIDAMMQQQFQQVPTHQRAITPNPTQPYPYQYYPQMPSRPTVPMQETGEPYPYQYYRRR